MSIKTESMSLLSEMYNKTNEAYKVGHAYDVEGKLKGEYYYKGKYKSSSYVPNMRYKIIKIANNVAYLVPFEDAEKKKDDSVYRVSLKDM